MNKTWMTLTLLLTVSTCANADSKQQASYNNIPPTEAVQDATPQTSPAKPDTVIVPAPSTGNCNEPRIPPPSDDVRSNDGTAPALSVP